MTKIEMALCFNCLNKKNKETWCIQDTSNTIYVNGVPKYTYCEKCVFPLNKEFEGDKHD